MKKGAFVLFLTLLLITFSSAFFFNFNQSPFGGNGYKILTPTTYRVVIPNNLIMAYPEVSLNSLNGMCRGSQAAVEVRYVVNGEFKQLIPEHNASRRYAAHYMRYVEIFAGRFLTAKKILEKLYKR